VIFFWNYLFLLDEFSDVSEERKTHMCLHVNRNYTLRFEAIFASIISVHSPNTRNRNSKGDHKQ